MVSSAGMMPAAAGGPMDPRYHHPHSHHPYLRHPHNMQPTPHSMARSMLPGLSGHHPMQHFQPPPTPGGGQPGAGWPNDPFRDPYRYDPLQQLRYNPLMAAAFRAEEEERAKLYSSYQVPPVNALRGKDGPSPGLLSNLHMHHRPPGPPPGVVQTRPHDPSMMHPDMHKKEDTSQSR